MYALQYMTIRIQNLEILIQAWAIFKGLKEVIAIMVLFLEEEEYKPSVA